MRITHTLNTYFLLLFLLVVFAQRAEASHLRAGEITSRKISTLQYEFTLVLYRNTGGVDQPTATIRFGDGSSSTVSVTSRLNLSTFSATEKLTYVTTHTYSAPNIYYASFVENYRNDGILNVKNGLSGDVPLYLETQISIDPFLGANTSPQLLYPPVDIGAVGRIFTHNPGAWDPDGDSLAFKMVVPKQAVNTVVPSYKDPASSDFGGTGNTLTINPVTGLITWDKPAEVGLYNIAFIIEEWRNGVKIGYITRDMQIAIKANNNNPPTLLIPTDTCITAGTLLKDTIVANDVAHTYLGFTAISGIFDLSSNPATWVARTSHAVPDSLYFQWQTTCSLVREQPYMVTFRADDTPSENANGLVTLKTWQIKIKAPKPQALTATPSGRNMVLKWKNYQSACNTANYIYILRKDCVKDTLEADSCTVGTDAVQQGYTLLGTVKATDTTFTDTNGGKGLQYGSDYTYIIYASFASPQKGNSRASDPAFGALVMDIPVISNVSVTSTDSVNGSILVKWVAPKTMDVSQYPAPYTYEVYRKNTANTGAFALVSTHNSLTDTSFTDTGLDTWHNQYSYFVKFYVNNGTLKYTTDTATSVRLTGVSKVKKITIGWKYSTPWQNDTSIIFRITGSDTARIDTVIGSSAYTDHGTYNGDTLVPGVKYKYFVETRGRYYCGNSSVALNITSLSLRNLSNMVEAVVLTESQDTLRPCPPVLYIISNPDCDNNTISNILHWDKTLEFYCDSNITSYKIYETKDGGATFTFYASVTDTFLYSSSNFPLTACYAVTAINAAGRESDKSNVVCSDNCAYYDLPNVFTPNGDGVNDTYVPIKYRNVVSVEFHVYNRWGVNVFNKTGDILINWDAANMPDGLYYYNATVTFVENVPGGSTKKMNGWIEILR